MRCLDGTIDLDQEMTARDWNRGQLNSEDREAPHMWTRYADSETVNAWGDMRRTILERRNCDSRRFKSNIQHRSNELSIFYDHSTIPLTLLYALHNQGTDTHLIIRNHHFFHCTFQLCTHGCISIPLLGKEEQLITIYSCWIGIHVSMRHRNSRLIAPSRTRWQGITTSRVKLIQKCRVSEKIKFHET